MDSSVKNREYYWDCWKVTSDEGRQFWSFEYPKEIKESEKKAFLKEMASAFSFDKSKNANSADLLLRRILEKPSEINVDGSSTSERASKALNKGFDYYQSLITDAGHQPADYGGPLFLLPGLIIASYITDTPFKEEEKVLMKQYIKNHQNADGGWGLHIEGDSTMFGTVLNFLGLRLLGEDLSDKATLSGKDWIQNHGGAQSIPPWGKFYLSILNVYDWDGNNSLFPEQWKTPSWFPTHPSKYWNHSRMVYLPMGYLYGKKYQKEENELIRELRTELYTISYDQHNWKSYRDMCHKKDQFHPVSGVMKFFNAFVNTYEKMVFKGWRRKSLNFCEAYIDAEDKQSNYINVGPVNQALNSICTYVMYGKDSKEFKNHVDRWKDYLWVAEDGMKMNGYNGSQFWDTIFGLQGLQEAGIENKFPELTKKYHHFIDVQQIQENHFKYDEFYRDSTIGAWPFSTKAHGWTITDCTAEGIKTAIQLNKVDGIWEKFDEERLKPSVDLMLSVQNPEGGWASYEKRRGPEWLEKLNPAHIFTEIMVDYSFVECTSAVIQGLSKFTKSNPNYRKEEIGMAIQKAKAFLKTKQNTDGSFYGSWAVCFTYGTWFGIEGLLAAGENGYSANGTNEISKACEFLASKQREDGSWGESYESCVTRKYIEHQEGQVINTAWALLGLMAAGYDNKEVIDNGIEFIIKNQEVSGDFPQQGISGVFNGNCMITYTSYRNVFPLWALARYDKKYNQD